jgi:AraC-like DNA-binding protein
MRSAQAYILELRERGCGGICIQRDTGACSGKQCSACAVSKAGLCCRNYLISSGNSNILERDGGDYRNIMAGFLKCLKTDKKYDCDIKSRLSAEMERANGYGDELRRLIAGSNDRNLIFDWREYSMDDLLGLFPRIDRRPIRIELQLFIYMFHNFRYPVDLEHAESRFLIPRLAINRYMRSFFGYSYSSLLSKIRNEYSKILLGIPFLRIGEIGALVGYKSHYHYSLSFKRYEGVSPKEYRHGAACGATPE